jgi:hypothetical protein
MQTIWLVVYTHRHGDAITAYGSKAAAEQAAREIEDDPNFEPDRDETVEVVAVTYYP